MNNMDGKLARLDADQQPLLRQNDQNPLDSPHLHGNREQW
jgi:hypothetical protein